MGNLADSRILGLYVGDREQILAFETDRGVVACRADGDGGQTWFADIAGIDALLGQVVVRTEATAMESMEDGRSRDEEDVLYGLKIATAQGHVDIVFLNSSNGHYGGYLALETPAPDLSTMRAITDDWQAGQDSAPAPRR